MNRTIIKSVSAWMLYALSLSAAFAQCDGKTGFALQACQTQANSTNLAGALGLGGAKPAPLTTGPADAIRLDLLPPSVDPKTFKPLTALDRRDDGAFILKPGMYEVTVQSYVLDAGGFNPNAPAGFLPAPISGSRAAIIASLLKQIELHPDIPQADMQQLLLAVVKGGDLEQMPAPMQRTAARVLPKDMLTQLQGAAQAKAVENSLMNMVNRRLSRNKNLSQALGAVNDKENEVRQDTAGILPSPAIANAGTPIVPVAGQPVARGTWAQMPGGFYVRYLPEGPSKTRLQVIVPEAAIALADPRNPLVFDPPQFLAVQSQIPALRIGITLRLAR